MMPLYSREFCDSPRFSPHDRVFFFNQRRGYGRLNLNASSFSSLYRKSIVISNPELKAMALLRIAYDAEDSRNLLMQSQSINLTFIRNEPVAVEEVRQGQEHDRLATKDSTPGFP
mgnify:CR=1 FL=1